jgi:hypothetical protein
MGKETSNPIAAQFGWARLLTTSLAPRAASPFVIRHSSFVIQKASCFSWAAFVVGPWRALTARSRDEELKLRRRRSIAQLEQEVDGSLLPLV